MSGVGRDLIFNHCFTWPAVQTALSSRQDRKPDEGIASQDSGCDASWRRLELVCFALKVCSRKLSELLFRRG
jgi:hypothetical protein